MSEGKRMAAIELDEKFLEDALGMPKGINICGMWHDHSKMCLILRVEPTPGSIWKSAFPEVERGALLEILDVAAFGEYPKWRMDVTFNWIHPNRFIQWCREKWMKLKELLKRARKP